LLSKTLPVSGSDGYDVCPSLSNAGLALEGDDIGFAVSYSLVGDGTLKATHTVKIVSGLTERVSTAIDMDDTSYWAYGNLCVALSSPAQGFSPLPSWPDGGVIPAPDAPPLGSGQVLFMMASDLALDLNVTGKLFFSLGWTVDFVNGQTELSALDPKTGQLLWKKLLPSGPLPMKLTGYYWWTPWLGNAAPALGADGTVYVGNVDGLYAVDGATGGVKPGFPFKCGNVDSAPAIGGDGTIFFGTVDGTFYALNPDGTQRFKVTTGGTISSSPAIGPDGSVYFVSDDGSLYAIH